MAFSLVSGAAAFVLLAGPLDSAAAAEPAAPLVRRVPAGRPEYATSWFHNLFMGTGYRKLWVTPVDFPVLDLATFAGGLRPLRQVGSMQSVGLALTGADGKSYTFRTTDKDPTRILPPEWADSAPARLFQDATTANHPGVGFVVPALAEAAGILHTDPRYVFMPDDPALGEFRATFGGRPGTIEEYPLAGPDGAPGFAGAVEVLTTGDLWKRHLARSARVDTRALLYARLFDLWIGDWDRHNKQWRWLRTAESEAFLPLPEDRDQAFSKFGGLLLGMARATHPKFMEWTDTYENFEGFMTQGTEVDRWLLPEVDRAAFDEVAADLAGASPTAPSTSGGAPAPRVARPRRARPGQRTQETPRRAARGRARVLPAPFEKVDVHATDGDDLALVRRLAGGQLEVVLRTSETAAPWFTRTFLPDETREVRLYLYAGADRVVTEGEKDGSVTLRVIGGAGRDTLDESGSGGTRFYDSDDSPVTPGPGTKTVAAGWERRPAKPKETPWLEWRDWGSRTLPTYQLWWEPDPAVMLSAGLTRQTWGFRKFPYASLQSVQLQYSTGRNDFKFNYDGEFRRENSKMYLVVDAQASQLENLNYFGQGSGTTSQPPEGLARSSSTSIPTRTGSAPGRGGRSIASSRPT